MHSGSSIRKQKFSVAALDKLEQAVGETVVRLQAAWLLRPLHVRHALLPELELHLGPRPVVDVKSDLVRLAELCHV